MHDCTVVSTLLSVDILTRRTNTAVMTDQSIRRYTTNKTVRTGSGSGILWNNHREALKKKIDRLDVSGELTRIRLRVFIIYYY